MAKIIYPHSILIAEALPAEDAFAIADELKYRSQMYRRLALARRRGDDAALNRALDELAEFGEFEDPTS